MYKCQDCGHLFEDGEEKRWEERNGFTHGPFEQFSGCPRCGEGYDDVKPCVICGGYPSDEYDGSELPNAGVCNDCLISEVTNHFMEYLESLDRDEQIEFYVGKCEGGWIYQEYDIYLMAKAAYKERVELHKRIYGVEHEAKRWMDFVNNDPSHFAEWLIKNRRNIK